MEPRPYQLEYRFSSGASAENIPFELNSNKPFFMVRVAGTGPYGFLLDTGSISTVVDTETAGLLGIESGESFESSGGGEGTITGAAGSGVSLGLDGLEFTTGPMDILPINKAIAFAEGRRVEGLLGYDFFATFVVALDYSNQRMSVYESGTYSYAGAGVALSLDMVRGHPFVSATLTVGGKRLDGSFLIDTGWRSALSLNAPFVASHDMLNAVTTIQAITGVGVGGPTLERVGRVESLLLGPFAIPNPITNFSTARSGILSQGDMSGIIGGEVLRRFTVIFDYPHKQMILEPNAHFTEPYEFDMSGLMVTAQGEDLNTLRVHYVVEGSPGHEAGLREGDMVTAIDHHPAADMSLEQVRRIFKQEPGKEHQVAILRDGRAVDTKLRLRRLV